MPELDIWFGGAHVATTTGRSNNRRRSIVYLDAVVDRYGSEVAVLSCSLPTPGPTEPAKTHAYLEGLLPEGQALDAMAARVRNVKLTSGAEPETVNDVVLLLAEYGRECAGAVVVVPAGQTYEPDAGTYRLLDDAGLAAIVRDLPEHPLGTDTDRGVRMSLAGAQPKFLLARFDERWYEPVGGTASTHIVKPTTRWPDSAYNENLVMWIANQVRLTPAESWVETMGDTTVFVAERYDRTIVGPQQVRRRHQEDMCQAIGIRPSKKYEIGRPSGAIARLLRTQTTRPIDEIVKLFRQVAFRVIVGDEDGHGKNYSVCLDDGEVTLSPIYDCLCTLVYPDLTGKLGAQVGRQRNLANVDKQALLEEAAAMGILADESAEIIDDLVSGIEDALTALPANVTDGWDSTTVTDTIRQRIERLKADEQMGRADRPKPRRQATLDDLTR